MPRDDAALLLDMLDAARDAVAFSEGRSYAEFAQDRRTCLAVLKAVEIVGEAASQTSPEIRAEHSGIPWPQIVGMRNRLVHGYFSVDLRLVWDTVRGDLPRLIRQLEPLVPPAE